MPFKWFLLRVFPLWFCLANHVAWADASSDIEALIQNKQWAQAEQLIQAELKKTSPSAQSPQWRLMASQVLAGQGKTEECVNVLQALILEFPELPEPYNNLGVLLAAQGKFEAAADAFISAIQARANYKVALQNLGDLYSAMAKQAYAKAKALDDKKSLLPLPAPAASTSTTTNIRTQR